MQSELPAALNVFDTEYQLENSEATLVLFNNKLP